MGRGCSFLAEFTTSKKLKIVFLSLFLPSQQSLLRQQERVEERVQEIEEQLCKLDSDKIVVEVCLHPISWRSNAHFSMAKKYLRGLMFVFVSTGQGV